MSSIDMADEKALCVFPSRSSGDGFHGHVAKSKVLAPSTCAAGISVSARRLLLLLLLLLLLHVYKLQASYQLATILHCQLDDHRMHVDPPLPALYDTVEPNNSQLTTITAQDHLGALLLLCCICSAKCRE